MKLLMSILEPFRRKKVGQWSLAYVAAAWVVIQVVDVLGGRWGITEELARSLDIILVTGFFVVLTLAWYHGDKGHQKMRGRELLLITAILIAGGAVLVSVSGKSAPPALQEQTLVSGQPIPAHVDGAPWIAVLPFTTRNGNSDLDSMSFNLATRINSGLASFSHLLIVSRRVVEAAAERTSDPRQIGEIVGARYLMEGDLRVAGDTVRLTMQLISSVDGEVVWNSQADYEMREIAKLEFQDNIADRAVATIGDSQGVVTRALARNLELAPPESMEPYDAVLLWSVSRQRGGPETHLRARTALERAVEIEPENSVAWACLGHVYVEEFMSNYNPLPGSLERGRDAARRAVTLDPTDALAHYSLAVAQYFSKDLDSFRVAAERSIELNPNDASALALLGILISFGGDWDGGIEITERAMQLNPGHPGYYLFSKFYDQYLKGNYSAALDIALQINMPAYYSDPLVRLLAYVRLGKMKAAKEAADELYGLFPNFEEDFGRLGITNWLFEQPDLIRKIENDLSSVGLKTAWTTD